MHYEAGQGVRPSPADTRLNSGTSIGSTKIFKIDSTLLIIAKRADGWLINMLTACRLILRSQHQYLSQ